MTRANFLNMWIYVHFIDLEDSDIKKNHENIFLYVFFSLNRIRNITYEEEFTVIILDIKKIIYFPIQLK